MAGFRHVGASLDRPKTLPAVRKRGFTLIEPFDADSVGAQGKLPFDRLPFDKLPFDKLRASRASRTLPVARERRRFAFTLIELPVVRKCKACGFTLIELLVVIAIIALLVSILMPSLQNARELAKLAVCQVQLRNLCLAVHTYTNDYNEKLPFTQGLANIETYAVFPRWAWDLTDPGNPRMRPTGFGVLYDADYVEDHNMLYCPAATGVRSAPEVSDPAAARVEIIRNFDSHWASREYDWYWNGGEIWLRCDYVLGFWHQEDYSMPFGGGPETLTNYIDTGRVLLMADSLDFLWPERPYHASSHRNFTYQNVATVGGAVTTIRDVLAPENVQKVNAAGGYTWASPENSRPYWNWWYYYGAGIDLP